MLPVTNAKADEAEGMKLKSFTIKDAHDVLNIIYFVSQKRRFERRCSPSVTKLVCALDMIALTGGKQTKLDDFFFLIKINKIKIKPL